MNSYHESVYYDRPFFGDRGLPARNEREARNRSRLRRVAGGAAASPTLFLFLFLLFVPSLFASRAERLLDAWKPTNYNVALTFTNKLTEITSATTVITIVSLKDSLSNIDLDFGE